METITCQCPGCHTNLNTTEKAVGKKVRCGLCLKVFTIRASHFAKVPDQHNGQQPLSAPVEPARTSPIKRGIKSSLDALTHQVSSLDKVSQKTAYNLGVHVRTKPRVALAIAGLASIVFLWLAYAWFTGPPSQATIKDAITHYITTHRIGGGINFVESQSNIQVHTLTIEEIGIFNQQRKYWPVKTSYKGSLMVTTNKVFGDAPPEMRTFTGANQFALHQDDFGKWQADVLDR